MNDKSGYVFFDGVVDALQEAMHEYTINRGLSSGEAFIKILAELREAGEMVTDVVLDAMTESQDPRAPLTATMMALHTLSHAFSSLLDRAKSVHSAPLEALRDMDEVYKEWRTLWQGESAVTLYESLTDAVNMIEIVAKSVAPNTKHEVKH